MPSFLRKPVTLGNNLLRVSLKLNNLLLAITFFVSKHTTLWSKGFCNFMVCVSSPSRCEKLSHQWLHTSFPLFLIWKPSPRYCDIHIHGGSSFLSLVAVKTLLQRFAYQVVLNLVKYTIIFFTILCPKYTHLLTLKYVREHNMLIKIIKYYI